MSSFPSRPRLHSSQPPEDTPPQLRALEGVWRTLRRSLPPADSKGKGRATNCEEEENKENHHQPRATFDRPPARRASPNKKPSLATSKRPVRAPLRAEPILPIHQPSARPNAIGGQWLASSSHRSVSASTHKTAGSPPLQTAVHHDAHRPPGVRPPPSTANQAKRRAGPVNQPVSPAVGWPLSARGDEELAQARRLVSEGSSTAYHPSSYLDDRLPRPPAPHPSSHQNPTRQLSQHSLTSSTSSSSITSLKEDASHPAFRPLATLHLPPSRQALKHGHVIILAHGGGVVLWLRGEMWTLTPNGRRLYYYPLVRPQDADVPPEWSPSLSWTVDPLNLDRTVEGSGRKHERRWAFLKGWVEGERERGVFATVHLPSPTYDPSSTLTIHSDAPFPSLTLDLSTLSGRVSAHYSSRSGQTTIERRQEGLFVRRSVGRGEGGRLEEDERLVWLALERVLEERVGERLWGTMGSSVR